MNNFMHNIDWATAMRTDLLTDVFRIFTYLGHSTFMLLVLMIGLWIFNKKIFSQAGFLLVFTALLNLFLKEIFQDPRPDTAVWLDPNVGNSYGFPSGHAQMATVFWMWIAWELRKTWIWIISGILVIGICFSRIYLGVHDMGDILGGALIGLFTLSIFYFFSTKRFKWWFDLNPYIHTVTLGFVVLLIILSWPGQIYMDVYRYGGFLIGFLPGSRLEDSMVFYQKHPKVLIQILATIVGLTGFIILKKGMGLILTSITMEYHVIMLFRAMVIGSFISIIVPWGLIKLKLGERLG